MISVNLLRAATGSSLAAAELYAPHLDAACQAYGIDSADRLAAFLAQLAHESGSLRYVREIADGSDYEGRVDLGNTESGDGKRFPGRGLIQLTGRFNARAFRDAMRSQFGNCPDFESDPARMEEPKWACLSSAWFWHQKGLNDLADGTQLGFIRIGRAINRGNPNSSRVANGEADRLARWDMAKAALATYLPPQVDAHAVGASDKPQTHSNTTQAGEVPDWTPEQPKEKPMAPIAISLLTGLAQSLYSAFVPLAHEKLTKELARHTSHPEVAEQVATATIQAVQQLTGKSDPIEAVVAAKADSAIMQQVQDTVLAELEKFMPILERAAAIDRNVFTDEEASRDAAAKRAAADRHDQDPYLTVSIVRMMVGLMVMLAVLMGVLAWMKVGDTVLMGVFGLFNAAGMILVSKFGTRYDHRYGSSAGSAAKDAVVEQLSRRKA